MQRESTSRAGVTRAAVPHPSTASCTRHEHRLRHQEESPSYHAGGVRTLLVVPRWRMRMVEYHPSLIP